VGALEEETEKTQGHRPHSTGAHTQGHTQGRALAQRARAVCAVLCALLCCVLVRSVALSRCVQHRGAQELGRYRHTQHRQGRVLPVVEESAWWQGLPMGTGVGSIGTAHSTGARCVRMLSGCVCGCVLCAVLCALWRCHWGRNVQHRGTGAAQGHAVRARGGGTPQKEGPGTAPPPRAWKFFFCSGGGLRPLRDFVGGGKVEPCPRRSRS